MNETKVTEAQTQRMQMDFAENRYQSMQSVTTMAESMSMTYLTNMTDYVPALREKYVPEAEKMSQKQKSAMRRKEEKTQKESKQEKAAQKRAESSGLAYAPQEAQELLAERAEMKRRVEEEPHLMEVEFAPQSTVPAGLFAPDPDDGQVYVPDLLMEQRKLAVQVNQYKQKLADGEPLNNEEVAYMEAKVKLLPLLQDAVKTYFAAGGADIQTGKTVSNSMAKKAKAHLNLAIERYQEAAANLQQDALELNYRNEVGVDEETIQKEVATLAKTMQADNQSAGINSSMLITQGQRTQLAEVQELIVTNSTRYQENKPLVEKIYKEMADTYKAAAMLSLRDQVEMRHITADGDFAPSEAAMEYHQKQADEVAALYRQTQFQAAALRHLMTRESPKSDLDAAYMLQAWGIKTVEISTFQENANKALEVKKSYTATQREDAAVYQQKLHEYQAQLQAKKEELERRRDAGGDPAAVKELDRMETSMANGAPAVAMTYMVMKGPVMAAKWKLRQELGEKYNLGDHPTHRDLVYMFTPVETVGEVNEVELMKKAEQCTFLYNKKQKDDTVLTEDEKDTLYAGAITTFQGEEEAVRRYMEERPVVFANGKKTMAEVMDAFVPTQMLHTKVQSLETGMGAICKNPRFAKLPYQQQLELKNLHSFYGRVRQYCLDLIHTINKMGKTGATLDSEADKLYNVAADLEYDQFQLEINLKHQEFETAASTITDESTLTLVSNARSRSGVVAKMAFLVGNMGIVKDKKDMRTAMPDYVAFTGPLYRDAVYMFSPVDTMGDLTQEKLAQYLNMTSVLLTKTMCNGATVDAEGCQANFESYSDFCVEQVPVLQAYMAANREVFEQKEKTYSQVVRDYESLQRLHYKVQSLVTATRKIIENEEMFANLSMEKQAAVKAAEEQYSAALTFSRNNVRDVNKLASEEGEHHVNTHHTAQNFEEILTAGRIQRERERNHDRS